MAVAQQEAEVMGDGSEVNVVDDEMIARPVVELAGKAALMFPCSSILGHVMLHIKVRFVCFPPSFLPHLAVFSQCSQAEGGERARARQLEGKPYPV